MNEAVKISFLGDFCPINRTEKLIIDNDFNNFNETRDLLKDQDIVIANLECPLTLSDRKIRKIGPNLKGNPITVNLIKHLNINMTTLANNHILDYGRRGIEDTFEALRNNEIDFIGAGDDLEDARKPLIKEINGIKIGFINICEIEFNIAGENYPGANPDDIIDTLGVIENLRKVVDFVILIYHGGIEYYNFPFPNMQKKLRFYSSKGVDLIICHHTHIISGFEIYDKTPIFYGLGNFVFDGGRKEKFWHENIMVKVILKKHSKIEFEIIPLVQCNNVAGVCPLPIPESKKIIEDIGQLSAKIGDSALVQENYKIFTHKRAKYVFANLFAFNKNHRRLIVRGLFPNFSLNKRKKLILFNQFLCESHKDVISEALKTEIYESRNF